jgi:CBS-domain-containing membrane protein
VKQVTLEVTLIKKIETPWSESARELYQPSDRRLSAKSLPTFADKGCHVVSVMDPYGRILGFIDRSRRNNIMELICVMWIISLHFVFEVSWWIKVVLV